MIKVIIVEDEFSCREFLKNTLKQHFIQLDIIAEPDNVPDAVTAIREHEPDIVYIDVEIKLGTGLDVLAQLKDKSFVVIFTTAFDKFAIEAFRHQAIDYLLKPIQRSQIIETTRRAIQQIETVRNSRNIDQILQRLQLPDTQNIKLSIYTLKGIEFEDIEDIIYAEAKGNYTEFFLRSGKKVTSSRRIGEIEEGLPVKTFFRIHHSYIVNLQYVIKYHKGRGGYIILQNGQSLPVSQNRKDEFLKWLQ